MISSIMADPLLLEKVNAHLAVNHYTFTVNQSYHYQRLFNCCKFTSGVFRLEVDEVLPDDALASVSLPPELFRSISNNIMSRVGIFFVLYTEPTLFPIRRPMNDSSSLRSEVASPVVAAAVGPGLRFSNLDPPVVINLRLNDLMNVSDLKLKVVPYQRL